jgi:hypothetical protein
MNQKLLFYFVISIVVLLPSCNVNYKKEKENDFQSILAIEFPAHFPDNTADAIILRKMVKEYVASNDTINIGAYIQRRLGNELWHIDSAICIRLKERFLEDDKLLRDCAYLVSALKCKDQFQSEYFNVYNINSKVSLEDIALYDRQYEKLKKLFKNTDTCRLNLYLDTNLNYWRAFPPWYVKYGLLQRYINGNPHELVHHFFTQYSDVPFFQEPMAFLYGGYRNNAAKFYEKYTSLNKELSVGNYVLAKENWHFPAIVILEQKQKQSFWLFTSVLMQKFGIEKFIEFASLTTWDKSNDDFERNFAEVYGMALKKFEKENIISKLKQ